MNRKLRRGAEKTASFTSAQCGALLAEAVDHHQSGRLEQAQTLYRKILRLVPGEAEIHYNLGLALMQSGKTDAAAESWRKAAQLRPGYAKALTNLGIALAQLGREQEAADALGQSLAAAPDLPETHSNLAIILGQLGRETEGETHARSALALRPDYAEAWNNLGILLQQQGRVDDAVEAFRRAITLLPDFAKAHFNLSLALLLRGDLAEGWSEREWRLAGGVSGAAPRAFSQPAWNGEPLAGRTILLYGEQGFGDSLQFLRFCADVAERGGKVLLEVPRPLVRLAATAPGVSQVVAAGDRLPAFDCQMALMSLPRLLGITLDAIPAPVPYLHPDAQAVTAWSQRLVHWPGRKIGLVWSGDPRPHDPLAAATDRRRSLPLSQLAPLLDLPGHSFVSLQKGPAASQTKAIPAAARPREVMAEVKDFADTAALIAALDLVITVDTAVAHLAGALGKPVWILSRFDGCWRWLTHRADSPWYPTARLFRQTEAGDWRDVVERVKVALLQG